MTKILIDNAQSRARAAQLVASGGVLAFRTDTFYGLGADPFNRDALKKLNELKGIGPKSILGPKAILLVIGDLPEADRFIRSPSPLFKLLAERHWPGSLTLVADAKAKVPSEMTAGTGTIGVRLPDDEEVRAFVRACGGALTATSANPTGEPPAGTAREAARYFKDRLDLVIDGGPARSDLPSTIIDTTGQTAKLIREGALPLKDIRRTLRSAGAKLLTER
jgi:L-threonylcarbamoyladenylate synthase